MRYEPRDIKRIACTIFGISEADLVSNYRHRKLIDARTMCMYYMRYTMGMTYAQIGDEFKKNHATVIHLCNKHQGFLETKGSAPDYARKWEEFTQKCVNLIMRNETLFADGFHDAIVGLWTNNEPPIVVYDKVKMINILMRDDEMSYEDAEEYLAYNTWGAYVGKGTPMYIEPLNAEEIEDALLDY